MNTELREEADGRILHVRMDGNPDKAACDRIVAETRRLVGEHGSLALVVEFTAVPDENIKAPWSDVDFSFDHFKSIRSLALVGAEEGEWSSGFVRPFSQTRTKFFPTGDAAGARRWIEAHEGDPKGARTGAGDGPWWLAHRRQAVIALFLSGLGLVGLMLQHFMKASVWWYWLIVVLPTFGYAGMRLEEWSTGSNRGDKWTRIRAQVLHWSGFAISLVLIRILIRNGSLIESDSGLVSLMTLSMACYFAGAHLNRVFFIVALVLTTVFIFASFIEGSMSAIFTLLIVLVAGIVVYQKWFAKDGRTGPLMPTKGEPDGR